MNLRDLAGQSSRFLLENSPQILTAIGVVGTVSTAILAGRASFRAADIIAIKEGLDEQRGRVMPEPRELIKERMELIWKLYIPPAIMATATAACIIGANRVSAGRAAGIATAYTLLERNLSEHREKLVEKLGERKAETFYEEIAQDRVNANPIEVDDVMLTNIKRGELCYDMFGGQYFTSTVEDIRSAVNTINATLIDSDMATLADFYRLLGIDTPSFSETIGWNANRLLKVRYDSTLMHETKPCITISFSHDPMPDYGRGRFH